MRVLYISRDYTTHDRRFLQGIADQDLGELFMLRLERDGISYETRPLPEGVREVEWAGGRAPAPRPEDWLALLPAFGQAIEAVRPDIIHAGPLTSCAFLAAVVDACPLVAMSWASDVLVDAQQQPWRWMARYALQRAAALVCDADSVREAACALTPRPPRRIVQFPWGVNLQRFRPATEPSALRRRLRWENARVVIWTRTWEPIYDLATGLHAFALAAKADPALRMVLLGDGSLARDVTLRIERHELEQLVHRVGRAPHDQLPSLLQSADVYLSCARCDGSSVSLLEAMAVGLAPVVTDLPSNREWIPSPEHGWLAKAGDPHAFARCLRQAAMLSASERRRLQTANLALVEDRADWPANLRRLAEAYRIILRDEDADDGAGAPEDAYAAGTRAA